MEFVCARASDVVARRAIVPTARMRFISFSFGLGGTAPTTGVRRRPRIGYSGRPIFPGAPAAETKGGSRANFNGVALLALEGELKALMRASLAGDRTAYRGLLGILAGQLRRYFRRRLAQDPAAVEDLVQEALIAIHTKRETWDPALPFTPWVYAIARYKLADHLRRNRIRATLPLDAADDVAADDTAEGASARADLDKLLASLPAATQDIIRKVKLEGRSTAEVAHLTGKSEIAVRVGLHRGLKALASRLTGSARDADR